MDIKDRTTIKADVSVPFLSCSGCKFMEIEAVNLYAGGEVVETIQTCAHTDVCVNAISRYTSLYRKKQ